MILARRRRPRLRERLFLLVWPRRNWSRSLRYYGLRLLRQSVAPDVLARGVAVGLFAATLPIFGLQMLLALILAVLVRGHVPAALIATFWANPVTIPVMAGLSYWTGAMMLGLDPQHIAGDLQALLSSPLGDVVSIKDGARAFYGRLAPVFEPLLLGSIPLAIAIGATGYAAVYVVMSHARRSGYGAAHDSWRATAVMKSASHQSGD